MLYLGSIPGLNGDEGMHSLEVHHFLNHEPVSLWVPSGRIANPFYIYTAAAIEGLLTPSGITMRLAACLSGFLFLGLLFLSLKQIFNGEAAILTCALAAISPLLIAYSRLALDTSQIALGSLAICHFALNKKWAWLPLYIGLAYLMHPINVFLLPLIFVMILGVGIRKTREYLDAKTQILWSLILVFVCGLVGLVLYLQLPRTYFDYLRSSPHNFKTMTGYFLNLVRVISGTLVYEGFTQPPGLLIRSLLDGLVGLGLILLVVFAIKNRNQQKAHYFDFTLGVLLSLVIQSFIMGDEATTAGKERYLIPVFIPILFLVGLVGIKMKRNAFVFGGLGIVILGGFYQYYWMGFLQTGGGNLGGGARIYKAAPIEPNQAILNRVNESRRGELSATVLTEGWLTQPMQYLALDFPKVNVTGVLQEPSVARVQVRDVLENCGYVAYVAGEHLERILHWIGPINLNIIAEYPSYSGMPFVQLAQSAQCSAR